MSCALCSVTLLACAGAYIHRRLFVRPCPEGSGRESPDIYHPILGALGVHPEDVFLCLVSRWLYAGSPCTGVFHRPRWRVEIAADPMATRGPAGAIGNEPSCPLSGHGRQLSREEGVPVLERYPLMGEVCWIRQARGRANCCV